MEKFVSIWNTIRNIIGKKCVKQPVKDGQYLNSKSNQTYMVKNHPKENILVFILLEIVLQFCVYNKKR